VNKQNKTDEERKMKTVLFDKATLKEQINQQKLFSLVKVQVEHIDDDGSNRGYKPQPNKTGYKAVVESGDFEVIAMVKPRYKLLQFAQGYNALSNELDAQGINYTGTTLYHFGKGAMYILPDGQKTGVALYNSVDKTNAITQRFFIYDQATQQLYLLPEIKGLISSHRHTTNSVTKATDLLTWIAQITQQFDIIQTEMIKYQMTEDMIKELNTALNLPDKKGETLITILKVNGSFTLWQYFTEAFKIAQERKVKSEIHQAIKEDRLSDTFFKIVVEKLNATLKAHSFIMEFA